jgi:hypothetical protein|tara:strand:- start:150 stop:341 length:192 start_codon:yes stop_codon:yes gene_type:complete
MGNQISRRNVVIGKYVPKSMGIANPTPALDPVLVKIAVFMPTSRPLISSNAPPLFPGLIAASV